MTRATTVVHLLAGLPYEGQRSLWAALARSAPLFFLAEGPRSRFPEAGPVFVVVPPYAEPGALVEAWRDEAFLSHWLGRPGRLGSVTTVIEGQRLEADLRSTARLDERGWAASPFDRRCVADLVVEQVEAASRIVLLGESSPPLSRWLRVLNPAASLVRCRGDERTLVEALMSLGGVSVSREGEAAGASEPAAPWLRALRGEPAWPEGFADGVCVVYERPRPFDGERFLRWLETPLEGVLRGKGRFWLQEDWDRCYGYSCAGAVQRAFDAGSWWASAPSGHWPECPVHRRRLLETWHPVFGDRRQQIAFVGVDLDPAGVVDSLDACLAEPTGRRGRVALGGASPGAH